MARWALFLTDSMTAAIDLLLRTETAGFELHSLFFHDVHDAQIERAPEHVAQLIEHNLTVTKPPFYDVIDLKRAYTKLKECGVSDSTLSLPCWRSTSWLSRHQDAGRRLRWLVSASRRRGLAVTGSNIGWSRHASDALLAVQICAITAFLPPSDQLRYRCASDYPRRPDPVGEGRRSVPAALWPGIRLFFSTPTLGFEQLGCALSVALGLVGTRITLSRAAASLGSVTTAASVSRVLQAMHRDSRWPDMLAALTGLAELLDAGHCPINYAKTGVPSRSPASFLRKK